LILKPLTALRLRNKLIKDWFDKIDKIGFWRLSLTWFFFIFLKRWTWAFWICSSGRGLFFFKLLRTINNLRFYHLIFINALRRIGLWRLNKYFDILFRLESLEILITAYGDEIAVRVFIEEHDALWKIVEGFFNKSY